MEFKSGNANKNFFTGLNWAENKLSWQSGNLVQVWSFASDWKAPGNYFDFWEPVFHSVLPMAHCTFPAPVERFSRSTNQLVLRLRESIRSPQSTLTPILPAQSVRTVPAISITTSSSFSPGGSFYSKDSVDSWLVKVAPDNSTTRVSYSVLTPGTPGPDAGCEISFPQAQAPWPPSPTAVAPTVRCGPMRVALNIAPAIAPDGTIYTIARSHAALANRSGFLVAVNPNLTS